MAKKVPKISNFAEISAKIRTLEGGKRELAESLFNKLKFIDCEIEKLQEVLLVKGWVEPYQNGANQGGMKKSSEGEAYNSLIKSYNMLIKQLSDLLPEKVESDELVDFLKG